MPPIGRAYWQVLHGHQTDLDVNSHYFSSTSTSDSALVIDAALLFDNIDMLCQCRVSHYVRSFTITEIPGAVDLIRFERTVEIRAGIFIYDVCGIMVNNVCNIIDPVDGCDCRTINKIWIHGAGQA